MIEPGSNGLERLLTLRLNTTAGPVTRVSVYAPIMSATSDTKDEFYGTSQPSSTASPAMNNLFSWATSMPEWVQITTRGPPTLNSSAWVK